VVRILEPSSQRITPACPHFGVCGGCSMQHLEPQPRWRPSSGCWRMPCGTSGGSVPDVLYPPIVGPAWGYRYRARLTVRMVPSKGGVLIGFHERRSSYVAPMDECAILPPHVSAMVPRLRSPGRGPVGARSPAADRDCRR
jgi:23S rRNA (uracil1939-C5)-methyltransferase